MLTRGGICVPPTVTYLPYRVSGSTLTAAGVLSWWSDGLELTSGFYPESNEQHRLYLGVYLKRTCSRVTSASSALGVLNDYAVYKSTHSLTHSLLPTFSMTSDVMFAHNRRNKYGGVYSVTHRGAAPKRERSLMPATASCFSGLTPRVPRTAYRYF